LHLLGGLHHQGPNNIRAIVLVSVSQHADDRAEEIEIVLVALCAELKIVAAAGLDDRWVAYLDKLLVT